MSEIRVACPQCRLEAQPDTLLCPGCQEDLAPLAHLLHRGRISYNTGLAHARRGDHGQARAALEQAVQQEPGLAAAWLLLGKIAVHQGESARAAEALTRAAELSPDDKSIRAALTAVANPATT
ncbi:tetratricopeptide repeat protein [Streptacidiphilus carbonis]|uniref:tetratricopeptide repeat protein n=1 Tax=Streptacidiphilus carbonis TaxID=105422 RepID=UPI0005A8F40C|nr:tetratricopeptide repeat protein [Streptacidiphilus carbonis]